MKLIKITKNNWRPFIELTLTDFDNSVLYFDVTKRVELVQCPNYTSINMGEISYQVKESAKDIIKAVDKLIAQEQDKKAEEARKYMEETMARAAETQKQLEK